MLISESARTQQQTLHEAGGYGTMGEKYAPLVAQIMQRLEVTHLLDYGCGSSVSLGRALKVPHKFAYQCYDPGVAKFASEPVPAEMVACIDVLEHVEPECVEAVLDDLKRLTQAVILLTIYEGPAVKTLPDGRNAHLTQAPMSWWLPKLWERFDLQSVQRIADQAFYVIAYAKPAAIENTDGEAIARTERVVVSG